MRRRSLGIQARLVMLALVTALPLVGLASFAILRTVDDQRAQMHRDVNERVDGLLADVDRQISAIQAELQVLAVSPSLQNGDLHAFYHQMRAALTIQGTSIVLHDTTGQQLVSTNRPFGEPLPRATNTEMHDRVVATGKPQISDLIMGAVLKRPILVIGVPVFRDGKVAYVLAMGLGPEILSRLLQDQNVSPDWTAAIFDRKGIIVARNRELSRFLGKPAAPIIREKMAGEPASWFPNVTSEGIAVYSTFRRSPITGWTVAIGPPREFVDAPLRRAQWIAFGGGGAVLALSLVLAWWVGRGIRRPVEALTRAASALGSGAPPGRLTGGVRELDQVADALHTAAEALARGREQLESTVEERTRELAAANQRLRAEIGAREQAQSALLQAQKMEAMGQLTGGVAHDFNNLLTAVSGALALLEPRISDDRSLRLLHTAQRGASRGAKLTESLLAFARKQRLDPIPADLNAIVIDISEMLRQSFGAAVAVRHDLLPELWPVLIDIGQIETALLNIAINARDAMPTGGILLIETANIPAGSEELPQEVAGQDCVLVSLRDTGTGMSAEVIGRAFEPFFTTKEVGKGTGLGLSMVFGVVRQSGGAVRIRSRLREGTTIQIYLPRAMEAVAPGPGRAMPGQAACEAHIVVVDDDTDVRWITAEGLREIGYVVTEAGSGRAALAILERSEPCDLMMIDLVMTGLTGVDTARLARRSRPELKVLYCSGYADMSIFDEDIGSEALIKKPFSRETLAEAVRTALQPLATGAASNIVPLRRSEPS
ncbi:MAG TPA: cache domain-containing protein [Stellaceae bacterium]|nr:cache domain-containing protein [Stellaceae bacterium]